MASGEKKTTELDQATVLSETDDVIVNNGVTTKRSAIGVLRTVLNSVAQVFLGSVTADSFIGSGSQLTDVVNESGNQNISGGLTVSANVSANAYTGDGSALTGIASGTGGVINTGSTTIGADSDDNGSGEIAHQIGGATKGGVDNLGVTHADDLKASDTFDMGSAEMISDLNQGGFELINSKTISEMQRGKGLHFNGVDQDVTIADDPELDVGSNDFSIVTSFRSAVEAGGTTTINIFTKGAGTNFFNVRRNAADKLSCVINDGAGVEVTSDAAINDNLVHNAIVKADRIGNSTMWLDGVLQADSKTTPTGNLDNANSAHIGRGNAASNFWVGEIYKVLLFNRLLTDAEAKSWSSNPLKQLEFKDIGGSQVAQNVSNCVNSTYTTFSNGTPTGFDVTSDGGASHRAGTADEIVFVKGKAYAVNFFSTLNSGTVPNVNITKSLGGSSISTGAVVSKAGANFIVFTCTESSTGVVQFTNASTATDYEITNLDVHQLGCIAEYRPDSIKSESNTWYDKQNGNNGVIDADVINDDLVSVDNEVETIGTFTPSHKAIIKIDGVNYKIQLDQV